MRKLWRVLVPTAKGEGFFSTAHHQEWDRQVSRISGGVTILTPVKGKWKSPDGELVQERIIPVDIVCSEEDIPEILRITRNHYSQVEVMAYLVSEKVISLDKDGIF